MKPLCNDEFDRRLHLINPNLLRCDDYVNSNTIISFRCVLCSKVFRLKPKQLSRFRCSCIKRQKDYLDKINKNIIPIDNYVNMRTKIKHKCLICDHIFSTTPKVILNSKKCCPSCSGRKFSIDEYRRRLPNNLILLSHVYIGSQYKHLHKCLDCGHEFLTKPNYILHMNTNLGEMSILKQLIIMICLKMIGFVTTTRF